jgi:hypothetical protein
VLASTAQADRKLFPSPAGWALLLFLLALIPRLPGLRVFLTSDEPNSVYWASSQFVEGLTYPSPTGISIPVSLCRG